MSALAQRSQAIDVPRGMMLERHAMDKKQIYIKLY